MGELRPKWQQLDAVNLRVPPRGNRIGVALSQEGCFAELEVGQDPAAGVFGDDLEQPAIKGCGLSRVAHPVQRHRDDVGEPPVIHLGLDEQRPVMAARAETE